MGRFESRDVLSLLSLFCSSCVLGTSNVFRVVILALNKVRLRKTSILNPISPPRKTSFLKKQDLKGAVKVVPHLIFHANVELGHYREKGRTEHLRLR